MESSSPESDEDAWYQNDLILAAQLGKTLLERNRDLENQIFQYQQINQDQTCEIESLTKQLDALREVSDSRMKIYEELDRTSQEFEKMNRSLIQESRSDKARIQRLCSAVDELENKCEELQTKADEAKAAERKSKEKKKNWSFPNLPEALAKDLRNNFYNESLGWTYVDQFRSLPQNPYEVEIRRSQELIRNMRSQLTVQRKKQEDLEDVIGNLERDSQTLESKNRELEQKLTEAKATEVEYEVVQSKYEQLCKIFGNDAGLTHAHKKGIIESDVEHDDPQVSSDGRYAKLGDGGSVYGSSESISKVVSETGERAPQANPDGDNVEGGVSILNEISAQYSSLIEQYEELLTTLSKRPDEESRASKVVVAKLHKEVQTLFNLSLQKTVPKTDTATSPIESVPTYKALFKDIFATLKKSQIEEERENQDDETPGAGSSALPSSKSNPGIGSSALPSSKSNSGTGSSALPSSKSNEKISGGPQSKGKGGPGKKTTASKPPT